MSQLSFEGQMFDAEDGETVLGALLRHGVAVDHGCQAGSCQSCLLRSEQKVPASSQTGLDDTVVEAGGFLACIAKAKDVPEVTRFSEGFFPRFSAILAEKTLISSDVLLAKFEAPDFPRCPGRFVQLMASGGVKRPYSVATSALGDSTFVDMHIRLIPGGAMNQALQESSVGDTFTIQGPFGKVSYRPGDSESPIVLIGSGTGLAPLYAVATDALSQGHKGPVELFFGSSTPAGLYYLDELKQLEADFPHFRLTVCVDADAQDGHLVGSPLTHALEGYSDMSGVTVYACGHPALVKAAQRQCFLGGASMKRIFVDAFEPAGKT